MMKKFIISGTMFFVPVLLLAVALEYGLRRIPNDYSYKSAYLDAHARTINNLILGSSYSLYDLDPAYFTRATFNASHGSQSLDFDFKILRKYENTFARLEAIVIPISYFVFFNTLTTGREPWRVKNYVLYYHMNTATSYKQYFELLSHNFNYNVRRLVLCYLKGNRNVSCTTLGRIKEYGHPQDLRDGAEIARQQTQPSLSSYKTTSIFQSNISTLREILAWSKEKHIKVVLFTPPACEDYRRNLNPAQLRLTVDSARAIAGQYGNCVYVNFLNDTGFSAGDFIDATHLSEAGARKLSGVIDTIIIKRP